MKDLAKAVTNNIYHVFSSWFYSPQGLYTGILLIYDYVAYCE